MGFKTFIATVTLFLSIAVHAFETGKYFGKQGSEECKIDLVQLEKEVVIRSYDCFKQLEDSTGYGYSFQERSFQFGSKTSQMQEPELKHIEITTDVSANTISEKTFHWKQLSQTLIIQSLEDGSMRTTITNYAENKVRFDVILRKNPKIAYCEEIKGVLGSWYAERQILKVSCNDKNGQVYIDHSVKELRSSTNDIWGYTTYFPQYYFVVPNKDRGYSLEIACGGDQKAIAGQIIQENEVWKINLVAGACPGDSDEIHFEGSILKESPQVMQGTLTNLRDKFPVNQIVREGLKYSQ